MSPSPNINSDLAVGAVITEFLVARAQVDPLISRRHCLKFKKQVNVPNLRHRNRGGTKIFASIWYHLPFLVLLGGLLAR